MQGQVDAANSGYITLARLRLIDKQHGPGDVRIPSDLTGRYRTHVPFGHRLLLHLSDTKAPTNDYPKSLQPSKTASMNSWSFGRDDALTYAVFNDLDGTPRVIVSTETETIFDFRLPNWSSSSALEEVKRLDAEPEAVFRRSDTIRLSRWRDRESHRAIVLWLESVESWEARRASR